MKKILHKNNNLIFENYISIYLNSCLDKADHLNASIQAGEIFREFLVGKTKDGKTWFQLEAHSIGGISNFVKHMVDYVTYLLTGKNVGQYGLSEHVDSKPILY